jgi:hypothetical protein
MLVPRLCGAVCALANAFIGAVARSVLFHAQQAQQPAGIVNDSQPASPFPQQRGGRGRQRVGWPRGAADERAELGDWCRTRRGCGEIPPFDGRDQPSIRGDDQSHVEVVVLEEGSDLL